MTGYIFQQSSGIHEVTVINKAICFCRLMDTVVYSISILKGQTFLCHIVFAARWPFAHWVVILRLFSPHPLPTHKMAFLMFHFGYDGRIWV